ncbi:hypothetical protein J2T57_001628 [Natronocella acetinitrilica]|uniref:Uncharacterized protein n=1 Tax=Natronocella acetinitrilica TaxID=414046 RepID=A0AAE3KBD1_9GAMM|nr:hypothetical protein [Natronocella acetinitrilica]MCP1674526.1 hypothetical protein [Natronocella acetinitrilica]
MTGWIARPVELARRNGLDHNKGEIALIQAEASYAQARYGIAVATVTVKPAYRVARDARAEHSPDAGPEL